MTTNQHDEFSDLTDDSPVRNIPDEWSNNTIWDCVTMLNSYDNHVSFVDGRICAGLIDKNSTYVVDITSPVLGRMRAATGLLAQIEIVNDRHAIVIRTHDNALIYYIRCRKHLWYLTLTADLTNID
jgi:hypothetical protein